MVGSVTLLLPVIMTFMYADGIPVSADILESLVDQPKPNVTDRPLGPPCCKVYHPPPPYRKIPRPNRFREGKCKDGNTTYQVGDTWNYSPECLEQECKEDGTVAINKCPLLPESIPEGWQFKADGERFNNFFPFCCKRAIPPSDPKEPGCYVGNRTVKVGDQVDIPGKCYLHVCSGSNQWSISECNNLALWHALEVLPGDLSKAYPDCCGKTVPVLDIVPDILDDFPSPNYLGITYSTTSVDYGNELTPLQVRDPPTPSNPPLPPDKHPVPQWNLLIMTDPDTSRRGNTESTEFLHWMVGNFQGDKISTGEVLAEYIGAAPAKGSGIHRYVFLLYEQPGKLQFEEVHLNNITVGWRENFSTRKFAEKYRLGYPKAFNVFRAQWDESVPEVLKQFGIEDV